MRNIKEIKEEVSKLLALASNPYDDEAKAALFKARELMTAHNLTEADIRKARATTGQKSPVLLNVVKKHNSGSVTFPYKKTQVLKENAPFWVWAEGESAIASEKEPKNISDVYLRELKRYGKNNELREKTGIVLPVPLPVMDESGLSKENWIAIYEQGNKIVMTKATEEQVATIMRKTHRDAVDGEVRGGRYYRFSPDAKKRLEINSGDKLLLTINAVDGVWMEIEKAPSDCQIGGVQDVFYHDYGRYLKGEPMEFSITTNYVSHIALPTYFLNKAKIPGAHVSHTLLPYRFDGKKLILEGLPQKCDACGKTHSTYKNKMTDLKSCDSCADELDITQKSIKKYGSLDAALEDSNSELSKYVADVIEKAVRANSYIKSKLEGIAK